MAGPDQCSVLTMHCLICSSDRKILRSVRPAFRWYTTVNEELSELIYYGETVEKRSTQLDPNPQGPACDGVLLKFEWAALISSPLYVTHH